jgi:hypothetical protein
MHGRGWRRRRHHHLSHAREKVATWRDTPQIGKKNSGTGVGRGITAPGPPPKSAKKSGKKSEFTHWELNPGPSPRQGDVMTATLWVNKQVVRA